MCLCSLRLTEILCQSLEGVNLLTRSKLEGTPAVQISSIESQKRCWEGFARHSLSHTKGDLPGSIHRICTHSSIGLRLSDSHLAASAFIAQQCLIRSNSTCAYVMHGQAGRPAEALDKRNILWYPGKVMLMPWRWQVL